ncbi:MAG: hypothetical protein ACLFTK_09545 [Anaerolineales bacterium]
MAKGWVRALTIERLAFWILFILLFALAVRVPLDTDTWWHLRAGGQFLDTGELVRQDTYSYTQNGETWINHSWGGQAIMTLVYRATGGNHTTLDSGAVGLALFTATLGTLGMGLVYRMGTGTVYSRSFVLVIGAATAAVFWSPRPQMFTFFLSALVLYVLYLYKWRGRAVLWALPIITLVWVNLHAGYIAAFIIIMGFVIGEAFGNVLDRQDSLGWRPLGRLLLFTGLAALTLVINPYGPRMWVYPFETAGLQTLNLFISEWQSPNFKQISLLPFVLMLFGLIGFGGLTRARIAWSDLSLVCGMLFLALWAGRNIALFALVATPVLMRQVDTFLTERGWQVRPVKQVRGFRLVLNWALLGLILLAAAAKIVSDLQPQNVRDLQAEVFPLDALAYIDQQGPSGNMLNDYNWGGMLIFTQPDRPVFVDGRTDLYGDEFLGDYFAAYLGTSDWQTIFETYDITWAFLPDESALTTLLREDPAWQVVYEDAQAAILEQRTP